METGFCTFVHPNLIEVDSNLSSHQFNINTLEQIGVFLIL